VTRLHRISFTVAQGGSPVTHLRDQKKDATNFFFIVIITL